MSANRKTEEQEEEEEEEKEKIKNYEKGRITIGKLGFVGAKIQKLLSAVLKGSFMLNLLAIHNEQKVRRKELGL